MSEQAAQSPETIPSLVRHWAETTPDAVALSAPDRQPLTYCRLWEQIEATAGQLRSLGITERDRVALVHRNGPELAAASLAVASAATCAPLNPAYRQAEFDFYLSDLHVKAVIVGAGASPELRQLAGRRDLRLLEIRSDGSAAGSFTLSDGSRRKPRYGDPTDAALVLHTSGTTSRPKIVPLTHAQLCRSARNVAETLALRRDDRCLNVMPLFHVHGLVAALLASLSAGAAVVCTRGFHAPSFHGWLAEFEPSWYTAVPTMHQAVLARAKADAAPAVRSSLRFVRSSSAPLTAQVHEQLEASLGVPVIEAYGMTEAAHQMSSNPLPPGRRKVGSVGLPTGIEIVALGVDDRPLASGEVGDIAVRGETVFSGYESNPEANAESFSGSWFRTGDEGSFDEDGYLVLRGRTKEIINRAGEKIAPAEVEEALLDQPDVVQAAVFSVAHERLGEDVGAAVVLRRGSETTAREIQLRVAERLADFKVPSLIRLVDGIPMGPTGKLQRVGLAERLGISEGSKPDEAAEYAPPRNGFEEEVAELWASTLAVERVGVGDDFFSLGGDSMLAAEMLARLAERSSRVLPLTTLMWAPTLGAFCSLLADGSWDEDSLIVPVQTHGARLPLFVTHGFGDEILNIAVLKRTLGDDQPLYAVRARLDKLGYGTIEEMADDYFREIRSIQPVGPYQFVGMCSGGAIVMELARCARTHGESVQLAAVIDPQADLARHGLQHYVRRTAFYARDRRLRWAIARNARHVFARWRPPHETPAPSEQLLQATAALRARYRFRRVPITLTVIRTMDYKTPASFWERYANTVESYEVPTPHVTIFQHPHADLLGEVLAEVLHDVAEKTR